jgi:fluoride exporter
MIWAAVALGGALGSMLRHGVNVAVHRITGQVTPLAVALVNVSGCLAIGVLAGMIASGRWAPGPALRTFVIVGMLGGFTTFSSFGLDVLTLVHQGRPTAALVNVVAQVILGLVAVSAGYALAVR